MENNRETGPLNAMKQLLRASVLDRKPCPYLGQHTEVIQDRNGKEHVYCEMPTCPYNHFKRIELPLIDWNFNECRTQGLAEIVKHTY